MQIHFFTLKRLAGQIKLFLIGATWLECFSQDKDELVLGFAKPEHEMYLRVSCGQPFPFIWPMEKYNRAGKNVAEIFQDGKGQTVTDVYCVQNERCIVINLSSGRLLLKMHGQRSNVILERKGNTSLFRKSIIKDLEFVPEGKEWNALKETEMNLPTAQKLEIISPILDSHFCQRIDLLINNENSFEAALIQAKMEAEQGAFFLVPSKKGLAFSLFPADTGAIPLGKDIVEAIGIFVRSNMRFRQYSEAYRVAEKYVNEEKKKENKEIPEWKKNLEKLEASRPADEIANILMANLHVVETGIDSVNLFDFYQNTEISIKLDPALNAQENAALWFRKQKKRKTQVMHLKEKIIEAEKKANSFSPIVEEFEAFPHAQKLEWLGKNFDPAPLKNLNAFIEKQGLTSLQGPKDSTAPLLSFHTFQFQGYDIFVGKNAKNNDALSFGFAKKNDVWLHAKDVGGSHVVVRNPTGKELPAPVLEFAAILAAKNSKRKNEKLVPVAWTFKKHVRKPKGFAAGKVLVDRETVLLVSTE